MSVARRSRRTKAKVTPVVITWEDLQDLIHGGWYRKFEDCHIEFNTSRNLCVSVCVFLYVCVCCACVFVCVCVCLSTLGSAHAFVCVAVSVCSQQLHHALGNITWRGWQVYPVQSNSKINNKHLDAYTHTDTQTCTHTYTLTQTRTLASSHTVENSVRTALPAGAKG